MVRCRVWAFIVKDVLTCRDRRHQALSNREDGFAVKAILAHDAIVHPDHPLRLAGKPGIELTIGEAVNYYPLLPMANPHSFQVLSTMARRA